MHYGHKRMIFEKDVAIQVRDGTVWLKHQRALKLEPGEIVPVDIEIWPSSTLFRKGEALQLTVQGGDFSYTIPVEHGRIPVSHARTVNRGRHTLHTGGRYNSHLLVPVIPQDN